jgi:hypothetical protein
MASAQSSSSTVRAGLVYQAVGLNDHLKVALSEAGVNVVLECLADKLVLASIRASNLDVFVVNLDPQLEDHLDELTEMLDQMRCPVIFNDGAASSSLGGWDQARWARHLAAKIKGELDANPPRPANAAAIPMPVRAAPVPVVAPIIAAAVAPVATAIKVELPKTVEMEAITLPIAPASPQSASPHASTVSAPESEFDDVFSDLDFNFDANNVSTVRAAPAVEEESDGLADFDASAFDMPELPTENFAAAELTDLDALLRSAPEPAAAPRVDSKAQSSATAKPATKVQPPAPLDLDFSELSLDFAPAPPLPTAKITPKVPESSVAKEAPLSWSLEPLPGEVAAAVPTGRAVYKAKDVEPTVAPVVAKPPEVKAPSKAKPPVVAETELSDFDFFSDNFAEPAPAATTSTPSSAAITKQLPAVKTPEPESSDFDALFADLEELGDSGKPASLQQPSFSSALDSGALDFDMDFEVGMPSSPAAGSASIALDSDSDFADLDALFADPPAPVASGPRQAVKAAAPSVGPDRVFVLGASIGGPEAVRSFLSKLKAKTPAAFILAQHMGAEFLELMTSQLAKASAMPVRLAKPGEKFSAGEIVVVPVSQRFVIDDSGHIQFGVLPTESPYSPSIDQVMIDMADRFGARCTGIIFSGMASDAIEGAKYLAARGAKVWVQDPATCVISSMIDGAQAAGVVSFVGAPEQLADHVLDDLGVLH